MSWLVLGAGTSGLAAAKLLRVKGHSFALYDDRPIPPAQRQSLLELGARLCEDGQPLAGIDEGLIVSPGIADEHPLLLAARSRQLPILSEIDWALAHYKGRLLGVSGTNGKSTTVAMLGYLLERAGVPSSIGGNIGVAASELIATGQAASTLVLELSSYQLSQSQSLAPSVAILTSFSPDHLARHGTMRDYLAAKWRLFSGQSPKDTAIIAEEAWMAAREFGFARPTAKLEILNSTRAATIFPQPTRETAFQHNRLNAAAAVLAAEAVSGRPSRELAKLLQGYQGLAHRCEEIGTIGGKPIVNDSKATNVASTEAALLGLSEPVILMLGGQAKGESFAKLARHAKVLRHVIAFGAAAPTIQRELGKQLPLSAYPSLKAALSELPAALSLKPAPLLFSPACASFDEFTNFEERGRFFTNAFAPWLDQASPKRSV